MGLLGGNEKSWGGRFHAKDAKDAKGENGVSGEARVDHGWH